MEKTTILATWHSKEHDVHEQLFPKSDDCCVLYNQNTASSALFSTIGNIYLFRFGKQPRCMVRLISSMRIGLYDYFLVGTMLFNIETLPIELLHTIAVVLNSPIVLKSSFRYCHRTAIFALRVVRP